MARNEERKRHKNKYTIVLMAPPPILPLEILPAYTMSHLQKGLYVEMWYFTNKGLECMLKTSSTLDENMLVQLVDRDGGAVWTMAMAARGLKTALDDRELTWDQFSIAIPRFVDAIHVAGWMEQRQSMMASLFKSLQMHPYQASWDLLDRTILLRYLLEQRRLWHQALDAGMGAWNIGILSDPLLAMAADVVLKEQSNRAKAERNRLASHPNILGA